MNETAIETTTSSTTWGDVLADVANSANLETKREEITDVIDVPADPLKISPLIVKARAKVRACRSELDDAKAEVKARKSAFESAEGELDELIDALETGTHSVEGTFMVEDDFRLGVERWFWKDTGELAREVALPAEKRQESLPFDLADEKLDSVPPPAMDDDGFDSTTGIGGIDPEDTDVTDPAAVLLAEANVAEPATSKPPSKPIKRGSKKAKVS